MRGHVFVSYDQADREYVGRLVPWLQQQGHEVAEGDRRAIDTCTAVVLVTSAATAGSAQVSRELARADALRKPVLELRLDGVALRPDRPDAGHEDVTGARMPAQLTARLAGLTPASRPWTRLFLWLVLAALGALVLYRVASAPARSGVAGLGAMADDLAGPAAAAVLLAGALRLRRITFAVWGVVIFVIASLTIQALARVVPITFLDGLRGPLGYPAFYGLVAAAALVALLGALVWHSLVVPRRVSVWSVPLLFVAGAAGALDYLYWQPYHFGPLTTWPFLLFLVILVEAGFEPERAVRRSVVYAALVFVVLSSVWVLSLPEVEFLNKQLAVGAVAALAVAALCLALVRTPEPTLTGEDSEFPRNPHR